MKGYLILAICLIISSTAFISAVVSADDTTIIRVGLYENPPKIFTDASGNISGFWPDIIRYIASEEGWEVEYVHGNWSECLQRLEKGEIDIMPDVAFSEGRSKLYDFSNEIVLVSWSIVYTRKGLDMQSIIDLKGKTIAVLNGSVNSDGPGGIKELVRKFDINCTFMEMGSYTEVFEALESGEADAGVTNRDFGDRHESQFDVKKTPIIFQPVDLKFAFPKNASMNPYLIERIDYHIRELKNDSSSIYYKSIGKYLENAVVEEEVVVFPVWAKDALYIASTVSIFLLLLYILSRMQVKRKTTELKESEEKYRTVIENANDGICIIKDGLMVFANPRLLEMGGYSEQDVINQPFSKFISEESLKEVVDRYKKRMAGEEVESFYETVLKRKDGSHIFAELNVSLINYEGGTAELVIVRDITEREKLMNALKESEERFRSLVENAQDAIYIITPAGFEYVNPAFEELTGYSSEEIYSKDFDFRNLIHPDDVKKIEEREKAREKGKELPSRYEFRIVTKDGKERIVEARTVGIGKGKEARVIGILRDMTERIKAEEKMKRILEQEKEFKLATAHYFFNPIAIAKGYLSLAMEKAYDEDQVEKLKAAEHAIERVEKVVKNVTQKGEIYE